MSQNGHWQSNEAKTIDALGRYMNYLLIHDSGSKGRSASDADESEEEEDTEEDEDGEKLASELESGP